MVARGCFVTGTDTGCGKTEVTLGLMYKLQSSGLRVAGMKPVASGAQQTAQGLRNEDALRIQRQAGIAVPYEQVNPYAYEPPIAPHLAAAQANRPIRLETILHACRQLAVVTDWIVVEGVGGWQVPLGPGLVLGNLVKKLNLPVILVVGMRLGCLNHAILSAESILNAGFILEGWVANQVDRDMQALDENLQTLHQWLPAPCLGEVPYLQAPSPEQVGRYLTLPTGDQ